MDTRPATACSSRGRRPLIARADAALYRAKRAGRDRCVIAGSTAARVDTPDERLASLS